MSTSIRLARELGSLVDGEILKVLSSRSRPRVERRREFRRLLVFQSPRELAKLANHRGMIEFPDETLSEEE
ncbi:MAG: hypothetical protein A3A33_01815 [Candidatus Yanofskybacteria bacterium RIFCSPLOWO2_01_FULL_49_25]|uniref:Uncharacterized protein n=1 Tax=Candidatus Yanofskybacteria bacterium RIFCSPLOWO2_01_FULL_49_25 TaxID=1802701 RepID=A0A1F8GU72_9BACT|nr:MAG: hypothetical protein A3A33_01815 [Candidatus Yanofskybacteria bacterium RIFCSPLOWO2_01_FULL_49_25]